MGRGKSWSREELEAVAKAWKAASEHAMTAPEQNSKMFVSELYRRFLEFVPSEPEALEGRWTSRSQSAVKTQFDAIQDDIVKFNLVLRNVMDQALNRGVTVRDDKVLRAAIGVHLKVIAGVINFDTVDSVESDWKLYEAWCILKTCERFVPQNWPRMQNNNRDNSDAEPSNHMPNSSSVDNGNPSFSMPSHGNLHSGGTPMRTLASAALSMDLHVGNGLSPMEPLAEQSAEAKLERGLQAVGSTGSKEGGGSEGRTLGKRRSEGRTLGKQRSAADGLGQAAAKVQRTAGYEMNVAGSAALELVGHALCGLGDALSEYNAITLFSRPEMQGWQEQKVFFETLAEKHVLKAKLDRDKLVKEAQQRRGKENRSNTFSERQ